MKQKAKRVLSIIICAVLVAFAAFATVVCGITIYRATLQNNYDFSPLNGAAKKTLLFIGDGMGFNHIEVASRYYGKEMFMTSLPMRGEATTFCKSVLMPTDSAAAASALSTGEKYYLAAVSQKLGKDVQTIAEYAKSQGLGVAIVTSDNLCGATPACFSAHANFRNQYQRIIECQSRSNFDLLLGAGKSRYFEYEQTFISNGYVYCDSMEELSLQAGKQIAPFESIAPTNGTSDAPTLQMLTEFAVDYMEKNYPQGYFIMIEGAHIDKRSHANDVFGMMEYLVGFDDSIRLACDKLSQLDDVAVIVTADHETGGLRGGDENGGVIDNSLYTRTSHSGVNVPFYMRLDSSCGVELNGVLGDVIDNTDVYKIIRALLTKQ